MMLGSFFLMVKADSRFVKEYVQGMSPLDAGTWQRQFCLDIAQDDQDWSRIENSTYFKEVQSEQNRRFIAAGGGFNDDFIQHYDDNEDSVIENYYNISSLLFGASDGGS
mmetsp:Transcript_39353/g.63890  ORF Transcript_39353/g.63890 Transcript_39353/m.63890 type:complete len:109 (+) Transcript_39353:1287-1613(+)